MHPMDQKDQTRAVRENDQSPSAVSGESQRPVPSCPKDYAGCWRIPRGAGLVGQRLEIPRSIAGQGLRASEPRSSLGYLGLTNGIPTPAVYPQLGATHRTMV